MISPGSPVINDPPMGSGKLVGEAPFGNCTDDVEGTSKAILAIASRSNISSEGNRREISLRQRLGVKTLRDIV